MPAGKGTTTDVDVRTRVEIDAVHGILDSLDYYQVLQVGRDAPATAIERAFAQESKRFHPDRFFGVADPDLQKKLNRIYRKVAEAWSVLKDPELKAMYDRRLKSGGAADASKVSRDELLQERDEATSGPSRLCQTRQGQKFYDLAMKARAAEDFNGVVMNLKFALQAEPDNAALAAQLESAGVQLEEYRKKTKNPYKIRII